MHDYRDGRVTFRGGMEVAQCDEKYREESYWKGIFAQEHCSIGHWDSLFQEDRKYREVDIAKKIPDNKYHCMVFHFVHNWRDRFRMYFCDQNVPEDRKVVVLQKQMRNIAVFSKKCANGSFWRMMSTPDDLLKQALCRGGDAVPALDSDGKIFKDLIGRPFNVLTKDINSARDPKPDTLDKKIYGCIRNYAVENKCQPPNQWTMVRSSFKTDEDEEVRCYAFSGSSDSSKPLHRIPAKWWKGNKYADCFFTENRSIYFCNVDQKRLSQNMILAVITALSEQIRKALATLTAHIAFEDKASSQSLILDNKNDLGTLDYGEYYDIVIGLLDKADDSVLSALISYLKKQKVENTEELIKKILLGTMVYVGSENRQFEPKWDELKTVGCLDDKAVEVIGKISQSKLNKLKRDLEGLPAKFLEELKKQLQKCHCGEDNVLTLLLQKYLETVKVFGMSPVEFVAIDANNLDGKPFCKVCDRKVRFYSVLPTFLQELGVKSNDQELLSQLTTLFARVAENPQNLSSQASVERSEPWSNIGPVSSQRQSWTTNVHRYVTLSVPMD